MQGLDLCQLTAGLSEIAEDFHKSFGQFPMLLSDGRGLQNRSGRLTQRLNRLGDQLDLFILPHFEKEVSDSHAGYSKRGHIAPGGIESTFDFIKKPVDTAVDEVY